MDLPTPVEIQIDNKGIVELGYRFNDPHLYVRDILARLYETHMDAIDDIATNEPEIISIHPQDGVTYWGETVVVSFTGIPTKRIVAKYGLPEGFKYGRYNWNIKYNLDDPCDTNVKLYDLEFWRHRLPALPKGVVLGTSHGIGFHVRDDERSRIRDIYFVHSERNVMREFFGGLYPEYEEDFEASCRAYCLSYHADTLEPVKMKRYLYVGDMGMEHPERI